MRTTKILIVSILAVLALIATACGDATEPINQPIAAPEEPPPADPPTTTTAPEPPPTTVAEPEPEPVGDESEPTTTTTEPEPTATTTTAPEPEPALPGEPYELFYPLGDGEHVGVVDVTHDDVLNVRALPGADQVIVKTLDPLARDFAVTGRARLIGERSVWLEIYLAEGTGWVHGSYISRLSAPRELAFEPLRADSLLELGEAVAFRTATFDEEIQSTVNLTLAPRGEHDLGEVAFDVIGLGDDSSRGVRVHVYGRPTDDRQAFDLVRVVLTDMCDRGVSANGLCV